jgi:hypothetical protein
VLANAGITHTNGRPLTPPDEFWLRVDVQGGKLNAAVLYGRTEVNHIKPLAMVRHSLTVQDGRVDGALEVAWPGLENQPVTLKIQSLNRMGRRLFGRVTCIRGDHRETTPWVGLVQALRDTSLFVKTPGDFCWQWNRGLKPDEAMTAQAATEARRPVMPGEPGKTGFWTWRPIVAHGGGVVSCIYPPSFGLQEVEGAARYRFTVTQQKGSPFHIDFDQDQPWHSLAPVWDQIPPHDKFYEVAVTALDADGTPIDAPIRLDIIDKEGQPAAVNMAERRIVIHKRPSFTGPVATTERSWTEAALLLGRIRRGILSKPEGRGTAMARSIGAWNRNGSDHGFATSWAASTWQCLAYRALTSDPAERQWAEEMLHFNLSDAAAHLDGKPKVPYDYQHQTPLAHWAMEALCDAYLQTGDDRFKQQALLAGRGVVALQCPDGSFASNLGVQAGPPEKWYGSIKKLKHYPTFATAELLYALGRLRRDLRTDEFAAAETKAYEWAMEHQVKARFWPLHVCHSHSQYYPNTVHCTTAFLFCRYLLECAPKDRRDLKLAEDVARWGEDYGVDWHRAGEPPEMIYPRIDPGDRYNNGALVNNLLAAIVFEELAQATGEKLWSAKGESLATAAVQGISRDGTVASWSLLARNETFENPKIPHNSFCWGWAAQLLREYAALR